MQNMKLGCVQLSGDSS